MLNNKFLLLLTALLCHLHGRAQFAPQAHIPGTDAIPADSELFVAWADGCVVSRGYMNIANPLLGVVSTGHPGNATGTPDGSIVSLGDSGIAVLTFPVQITNGPGPDFAVFENGFANPLAPEKAFLELAFVEVSSDGVNFYRFPAQSLTQTDTQLVNSSYLYAAQLHNLAGKYISQFGTPFDLEELAAVPGLDVNHITHVRIVDVVGDIGAHGSDDINGNRINDPYPTAFPSGGFDLDAVGVIHALPLSVPHVSAPDWQVVPNPTHATIRLTLPEGETFQVTIRNAAGQTVLQQSATGATPIAVTSLPPGLYFIQVFNKDQSCVLRFIKQ